MMSLDVSRVMASPGSIQLPGAITLLFTAATSTTRGQARVRYFIDESVPIKFIISPGKTGKEALRKSVELSSVHKNIEKKLNLQKEPEDAPDQALVRIRVEIQEIDNEGQPFGSAVRRSRMISVLGS